MDAERRRRADAADAGAADAVALDAALASLLQRRHGALLEVVAQRQLSAKRNTHTHK